MTISDRRGIAFFGPFALNIQERSLQREGNIVPLGARALDILVNLVLRSGEIINRHDLMDLVWRAVKVEEANLRAQLTTLRRALEDGTNGSRYIVNIPGQGYSFVSPVKWSNDVDEARSSDIGLPGRRDGLPTRIENVIGREDSISTLIDSLKSNRFVTVVGAGGIGKTTVAIDIAHRFYCESGRYNVFFVDLSTVSSDSEVTSVIASVFGCPIKTADAISDLVSFIRAKQALVILDSCEHVASAVAVIASRIFEAADEVRLLATSREPLRAEGETIYFLPPLEVPPHEAMSASDTIMYPAVQLFMERAESSGHEGALSDNDAPIVAEICRRMDGIALAIELAASRVGAFGIKGTAELLTSGAELQIPGRRSAYPRHQTLQAMVDWSFNLLSEKEQVVLLRLSTFAGLFSLHAALDVAGDSGDLMDSIGSVVNSLVEKSLVFVAPVGGTVLYRLLDTTRAYAALKLLQAGSSPETDRRHALHFVDFLAAVSAKVASNARGTALYNQHLGNIRKAFAWSFSENGDAEIGRELVANAAYVLMQLSQFSECYRWCDRALASLPSRQVGTLLELKISEALASSALYTLGNRDETKELIEKALSLATLLGDNRRQLNLLTELNFLHARRADSRAALATAERISLVAGKIGIVEDEVAAKIMLAIACHHTGDQAASLQHCRTAFQIAADAPAIQLDLTSEARGWFMFARALWLAGYPDQALRLARARMTEMERYTHHISYCVGLTYAIPVFVWSGCFAEAEAAVEKLLHHADKNSVSDFVSLGQAFKGYLFVELGKEADAIPLLRASLESLHDKQFHIITAMIRCYLAKGLSAIGQFEEAETTVANAIRNALEIGESMTLPDLLRVYGEILLRRPQPDFGLVETHFKASLTEARRQSAKGWELKAALGLADLWQKQGNNSEATALLRPLYGQYTEGFETMDLTKASDLLKLSEES